jgi:hypothetical protein
VRSWCAFTQHNRSGAVLRREAELASEAQELASMVGALPLFTEMPRRVVFSASQ